MLDQDNESLGVQPNHVQFVWHRVLLALWLLHSFLLGKRALLSYELFRLSWHGALGRPMPLQGARLVDPIFPLAPLRRPHPHPHLIDHLFHSRRHSPLNHLLSLRRCRSVQQARRPKSPHHVPRQCE